MWLLLDNLCKNSAGKIQLNLQTLLETRTCVNPQWNPPIKTETAAFSGMNGRGSRLHNLKKLPKLSDI